MLIALGGVPVWNWLLQGIGLCTAYAGAELNARQRPEGFVIWIGSNIVLATLHALTGLWILFALDLLFFRVNILGLRRWHSMRRMTPTSRVQHTQPASHANDA